LQDVLRDNKLVQFIVPPKTGTKAIFQIILSYKTAQEEDMMRLPADKRLTVHGRMEMKRELAWLASFYAWGVIARAAGAFVLVVPIPDLGRRQSGNRRSPDIVGLRQFFERGPLRAALAGLFLLLRCELRRSTHMLPALLRPGAALDGASAD
jgi:hypothetical protein